MQQMIVENKLNQCDFINIVVSRDNVFV